MINSITQANIDPNKFYVAAYWERWGALAYITTVEHKLFNPNNPELNKNFNMYTTESGSMKYFVMEVPEEYEERVKAIAVRMGLKVCDGTPNGRIRGKAAVFPLQGSNVWTLENRKRPPCHMTPYVNEDEETENIRLGGSPITF